MSRIELDFTAPGTRPGPLSWLLLALGLLAAGAVAFTWQGADAAAVEAQARLAALSKPVAKHTKIEKKADPVALTREREDADARRALALPWNRMLTVLQDTLPDDIALISLEADGHRGDFHIVADAKSHQAMLDYYRTLQAEAGLRAVTLTRHELREIDGVQGVNFSLRGEWGEKP